MTWWYLSFATKGAFLGAAVVEAGDAVNAVRRAHALGINPGDCSVAIMAMGEPCPCPEAYRNRLLSRADLVDAGADPVRMGGAETAN